MIVLTTATAAAAAVVTVVVVRCTHDGLFTFGIDLLLTVHGIGDDVTLLLLLLLLFQCQAERMCSFWFLSNFFGFAGSGGGASGFSLFCCSYY